MGIGGGESRLALSFCPELVKALFTTAVSSILPLFGCFDPDAPIRTDAGHLTRDDVDAIVEQGGAPQGMLRLEQGKLLIYPAGDILLTGCVLERLQATGESTIPSVANERHRPPGEL